jgi:Delta3-Delta2-enoyl-CoA isomerase
LSLVSVETRDEIAVLTLSRPKANALDPDLVAELFAAVSAQSRARGIVLASSVPGIFSAGWDLPRLIDFDRDRMSEFVGSYCDLVRQIFVLGPPVVAALSGHAIAGGLILAMSADERVAAEGNAKFGLSEVVLGVSVPQCLMEPFRHVIGARAMERLAATGENLTVDRAAAIGLIDRVAPGEAVPGRPLGAGVRGDQAALPRGSHRAIRSGARSRPVSGLLVFRGGEGEDQGDGGAIEGEVGVNPRAPLISLE